MTPLRKAQIFAFCCFGINVVLLAIFDTLNDFWTSKTKLLSEYDYIIVGSGTAGSLIGYRLATETNFSFIILEAGGRIHPLQEIPVLTPLLHNSDYDWQFKTVPQENACLAMVNNECKLTQGRAVGGSARLNNMIHVRGNISHYVDWFQGKVTEEDIQTQFDLIENNFIYLSKHSYETKLSDTILNAARELGYTPVKRHYRQGFTKPTLTQKYGKRWTTSDNLNITEHVLSRIVVEKLIIQNDKCIGVKLENYRKHEVVYARKGVIVAAGAFNSPKILQLSGIGPSKLLKSLDIPIIKDLPVGKNLQDHIGSGLDLVLFNTSLAYGPWSVLNPYNLYNYLIHRKGFYTSTGVEAIVFLSTKNNTMPDLQLMALPVGISSDWGSYLKDCFSLKKHVFDNYFAKLFNKHAASMFVTILHPKSKGEVYIASKYANQNPIIDTKYLTDRNDVEVLVKGLKLVKKLIETDAMKALGAEFNRNPFPGCEKHIFSDSYWECYIRHLTLTSYHPVGTCAMGSPFSADSVVDPSFKVLGIENLYVADSSVLPTLPSANINAAVTMMASMFFELNIKPAAAMYKESTNGFCYKNNLFLNTPVEVCDIM